MSYLNCYQKGIDFNIGAVCQSKQDDKLITLLILAIQEQNYVVVDMLIKEDIDIAEIDEGGLSPLHHAVDVRNEGIVKLLIENNADGNAIDNRCRSPLHIWFTGLHLTRSRNIDILRELLNEGADANKPDGKGNIPLHYVVDTHFNKVYVDTIRRILQHTEDVNVCDAEGKTSIQIAVKCVTITGQLLLVLHGVDLI